MVLPRAPRRALAGFQVVEYLRGFLCGRLGWNLLGGNLIISGAFGLFRRQAIIAIQGYAHDTVGEDIELVFRLRRRGYETQGPHQVIHVPDSVVGPEAPEPESSAASASAGTVASSTRCGGTAASSLSRATGLWAW